MWFSLDDAHDAALSGQVNNSAALVGILTAHAARARGWDTLRPHDAPWPERTRGR
jgi:ADP-ribose pyrophosphatase